MQGRCPKDVYRTILFSGAVIWVAVFVLAAVSSCRKQEETVANEPSKEEEEKEEIYRVEIGSSPVIGERNALVTIINFSDFECPFSKRLFDAMERILAERGRDIAYVYKHYPLAVHRQARRAAKAAIAASLQGKFAEMYRALFRNAQAITEENILRWAQEIGLDMARFETDFRGTEGDRLLHEDITLGNIFGVRGTPTVFINGRRFSGADIPRIEKAIEEEMVRGKAIRGKGIDAVYEEITRDGRTRYTPPRRPAPVIPKDIYAIERPFHAPVWGPLDAPVTIILFADLECPFSARFNTTLEELKKDFAGKLRVVFVNLPLKLHPYAVQAAKAAIAAGYQGKFWEFQARLFADQPEWKKGGTDFDQYLDSLARELGMNDVRFRKDMEDPRTMEIIHRDLAFADAVGVRGTPGIFINGRYASGAFPLESFRTVIREEIERARPLLEKGLSGDALFFEAVKDGRPSLAANAPSEDDIAKVYPVKVSGREPMVGNKNAPVMIVEFTDFQCPSCAKTAAELDEIRRKYGDTVTLVFKQFPLAYHPFAERAARFALAVKRLAGNATYLTVRRRLFEEQAEWGATGDAAFERYAKDVGIDWEKVRTEMHNVAVTTLLAEDRAEAAQHDVRRVPVVFVNGRKIDGYQPAERVTVIINQLVPQR